MNNTKNNIENSTTVSDTDIFELTKQAFCKFMRKNMQKDFTLKELETISKIAHNLTSSNIASKNIEIKMRYLIMKEEIQKMQCQQFQDYQSYSNNTAEEDLPPEPSFNPDTSTFRRPGPEWTNYPPTSSF